MARRAKPAPRAKPRLWSRRKMRGQLLSSAGVDLLAASQPAAAVDNPRVVGTGDAAFRRICDRISQARRSVDIRAFLWRDDDAGNIFGEAVLAAAERGAHVTIHKDRIAAVYEYAGGN